MILAAPLANLAALCTLETSQRMPAYEYNWFGQNRYRATSSEPLTLGRSTIRVEFKYDGGGPAKGGNVTMCLNDKKVAEGRVEGTIFGRFSADETFDIGRDLATGLERAQTAPYSRGEIKRNGRRGDSAITPAQINAPRGTRWGSPKGTQPRSQGRLRSYSA
jgi:hypothetical protein